MGTVPRSAVEELRLWQALAWGVVACAFGLRLIYSAQIELLPEEAYYWNYSRHLDLSYLDHPPMVAWLIRLGTAIFGQNEFGVRFGAVLCSAATGVFIFRLTREQFGESCALLALVFLQILPFFFLAGILMTPDAPLCAAWAGALYYLRRALVEGRAAAWLPSAVCFGVGSLSKYTIGLLGLATAIYMLRDPVSRQWLCRWQPYAAAVLALVIFSPVILWNAEHEWASLVFQLPRRLEAAPKFALPNLLGSVLVLLTPVGAFAATAALLRRPLGEAQAASAVRTRSCQWLATGVIVPFAVFALFSLRHEVKLDWTGASWLAALPLMAFGVLGDERSYGLAGRLGTPRRGAWMRAAWGGTIVGMLLVYATGLCYLTIGLPGVSYSAHTELLPVGWRELGQQVRGLSREVERTGLDAPLIVGMDRYAIASELAFYASDHLRTGDETTSAHLFGAPALMYEQWSPLQAQQGRTLFLVAWDADSLKDSRLVSWVDRLDAPRTGVLLHDGRLVRRYYYRVVHGYRPPTPSPI